MANSYYERHNVALALSTFLASNSWTLPTIIEGFQSEEQITVPLVSVHFLPSRMFNLQMASGATKSLIRRVQFDAYMETEPRAEVIAGHIMEFVDDTVVNIVDPLGANIGVMYCTDNSTITASTTPPNLSNPRVTRWRAVVQATFDAYYNL